jgi:hypothetical protein
MIDHSERREQIKAKLREHFESKLDELIEEQLEAEWRAEAEREEEARRARELRDMSDGDLAKVLEKEISEERPWRVGYGIGALSAELLRRIGADGEGAKPKPSVDVHTVGGAKIFACEDLPGAEDAVAEEIQLDAELRRMSDSDLAEVFEASVRSDDAEGVKALGAELLRRGADKAKQ